MTYEKEKPKFIFVPDTSVIINGQFLKYLEKQTKQIDAIVLSRVVLAEIEHQANQARAIGVAALEELKLLKDFAAEHMIDIIIDGIRPTPNQIRYAATGELDAQIRVLAEEYAAILVTSDKVQAEIGEVEGLAVIFLREAAEKIGKRIEDYFTEQIMSVHLREKNEPLAKAGVPGNFKLVEIGEELLTREELEAMAKDVVERAARDPESFIESDRQGSTVVQLKNCGIIITRPPFSDAMEITAARPIIKRTITDYKLDTKLLDRIEKKSEGLLIVGAPGVGKSTFATALAEFYADKGRIVKTFENPRDLQVDDRITQLSGFDGDVSSSADLILLMRPDHTVYDELRKTQDFETYADLRMSGIGLIGVIHGTTAIDGVKRFIKRVDLGVIPSIIDTIIFIEDGEISEVYTLEIQVKLPSGLKEKDLSRPVVEVRDFHTHRLEYEIYTFGEQIVVTPVRKSSPAPKLLQVSQKQIKRIMKQYTGVYNFEYSKSEPDTIIIYVSENDRPRVIGKGGKTIEKIESALGLNVDIRTFQDMIEPKEQEYSIYSTGEQAEFVLNLYQSKNNIHLVFPEICIGKDVDLLINGDVIVTLTVGKSAEIKLNVNSELGSLFKEAYERNAVVSALMK
ncbi:MAG: PIN domain-containing protein [Candidatus Heimdallarchaeaceae archaeon]